MRLASSCLAYPAVAGRTTDASEAIETSRACVAHTQPSGGPRACGGTVAPSRDARSAERCSLHEEAQPGTPGAGAEPAARPPAAPAARPCRNGANIEAYGAAAMAVKARGGASPADRVACLLVVLALLARQPAAAAAATAGALSVREEGKFGPCFFG